MISLHKRLGTWKRDVDAFIALTEFQKKKVADWGLPEERMYIKPHFYSDPPAPMPWEDREAKIIFVGRLGWEKGVHVLVDAWQRWGHSAPALEIIGDGPERSRLEKTVDEADLNRKIHFFGQLPFSQTQEKMARARLLVLPSLCFEGFPMVIREAFALSVPVAGSRIGSLPDIIADNETGRLFSPGDPADLLQVVKELWESPQNLAEVAKRARDEFEKKYTPNKNYEQLMCIYHKAIAVKKTTISPYDFTLPISA
jgi:glycosyltransferase involved in cell wall biosynthesis